MEETKNKRRFLIRVIACVLVLVSIFTVFGIQLVNWQLVQGKDYREKADSSNFYTVKKEAARGEILDANGVSLAVNETGYKVVFDKLYVTKGSLNSSILRLAALFDAKGQEWIDTFPIAVDENDGFAFKPDEGDGSIDSRISLLKSDYRLQQYATAEECVALMASDRWYDCENYSPQDKRTILAVRYNMAKTGYNNENKYTFADDVSYDMVAIVSENSALLPGVSVETYAVRKYEHGELAPYIVGSIGAITQDEYNEKKDSGLYQLDSKIGKTGIESGLEEKLVGKEGESIREVTSGGAIVGETEKTPAMSGNTVYLTIDARLQKIANEALAKNVQEAQKNSASLCTGSVVALNVKDFSVLCAQSYPNYDLTRYMEDNDYYNEVVTDTVNSPLFDRCFQGAYPIGSTMKPAVALAALQEGSISTGTTFTCNYAYTNEDLGGSVYHCMGTHGTINLHTALTVSCNVFFFNTGLKLGINGMTLYQKKLGLGQKTGVEMYERAGTLAGPEEREAAGGTPWMDGDTVNASIGQSDNQITPVQLATYCATIANDGVRLKTHLVKKVTDYSRQTVLEEPEAQVVEESPFSPEVLQIVKNGMRSVVTSSNGTGYYTFGTYEVPVAAKTGTVENYRPDGSKDVDHTTLIAYAPYDDPQIAIGIMMEHGKTGTGAANIAKAIFDGYFHPETLPDIE